MTKRLIEQITVEVKCSQELYGYAARRRCSAKANVTIVAASQGDLILVPVDWSTTVRLGQVEVICPHHSKERT